VILLSAACTALILWVSLRESEALSPEQTDVIRDLAIHAVRAQTARHIRQEDPDRNAALGRGS